MTTDRPTEGDSQYRLNSRGRPVKDVSHTLEAVTAMVEGLAARRRRPTAGLNDDLDFGELDQLVALYAAVDRQIDLAVVDLYTVKGYSWTEIGRALGITRQAARQQYGAMLPLTGADRQ